MNDLIELENPELAERPETRFEQEAKLLRKAYPELKEMPEEAAKLAGEGVPLLVAYLVYRDRNRESGAEALRRENALLRQNEARAARAPVRGVTGGDNTPSRRKSDFERGFDAGFDW